MPERILRPEILTSERVNQLDWESEVFYRRLMSVVDDFGRFDARPSILRSSLYPLRLEQVREASVQRCLANCEAARLVRLYVVNSRPYLELLDFKQRMRAARSKYPAPTGESPPEPDNVTQPHAAACTRMQPHAPASETETETEAETEAGASPLPPPPVRKSSPSLETVRQWAAMDGGTHAQAEAFWNHFEAQNWLTRSGLPITNARAKLKAWLVNDHGGTAPGASGKPKPKPAGDVTDAELLRNAL